MVIEKKNHLLKKMLKFFYNVDGCIERKYSPKPAHGFIPIRIKKEMYFMQPTTEVEVVKVVFGLEITGN